VKQIGALGVVLQLGWVFALCTLIPLGLGIWLDRRLGTAPLFILVGALVGIVASTVGAVRIVIRNIEALGKNEAAPPAVGKEDRA
jgi:F0F1-type ATP synthase assembly protein I